MRIHPAIELSGWAAGMHLEGPNIEQHCILTTPHFLQKVLDVGSHHHTGLQHDGIPETLPVYLTHQNVRGLQVVRAGKERIDKQSLEDLRISPQLLSMSEHTGNSIAR
jgi:hypothetical protein